MEAHPPFCLRPMMTSCMQSHRSACRSHDDAMTGSGRSATSSLDYRTKFSHALIVRTDEAWSIVEGIVRAVVNKFVPQRREISHALLKLW